MSCQGALAAQTRVRGRIEAAEDEIAFEGAMVVTPADATLVRHMGFRLGFMGIGVGYRKPH